MTQIADKHILQELEKFPAIINHPGSKNLVFIKDHFLEEGPNGSHLFLIFPFSGPSVLSMAECPGRMSGSRRLRGDLTRKVAKQVATAVGLLHSAGIIHGG
jgi:serine/threonine-protein kinase SRPK3